MANIIDFGSKAQSHFSNVLTSKAKSRLTDLKEAKDVAIKKNDFNLFYLIGDYLYALPLCRIQVSQRELPQSCSGQGDEAVWI